MNAALFNRASRLEETKPEEALVLYGQLEKENTDFHRDVLLVAVVCPILASAAAYLVWRAADVEHEGLITLAIIGGLGFLPGMLLFQHHLLQKGFECPSGLGGWLGRLFVGALTTLVVLFATQFAFIIHVLITGVAAFALLIPLSFIVHLVAGTPFSPELNELPRFLLLLVFVPILLFVMAEDFAEVGPIPTFPLRLFLGDVYAGVRLNWQKVLRFGAALGIAVVLVASGPAALLHEHLYETLAASGAAGALLGISLARLEGDLVVADLIRLGQARCLVALGRRAEARFRVRKILRDDDSRRPLAVEQLASALWAFQAGRPAAEYLQGPA